MAGTTNELVITSDGGPVVARINFDEGVLHGHCEWYDLSDNLVAYGFFKSGVPFTGVFLNWAKFFGEFDKDKAYDAQTYCQDWVTRFESVFDSELPKYEILVEAYSGGRQIYPPSQGDG